MRLKSIKVAGFKSFVDPTTIPFPTNLSAIVGPNGCGKSNTIDAVRWVMGESSAKHLRGESMTDVIFNGSNARKPVGQCSVELVFDNSDHTLQGQYAGFNEISIRRRVTRDGQSSYFLNGTKCRRKDVTDLFLGTGLGARSYAIIEQGMISRLIEAKPEELRTTIEEAAGISRYKERRRETENRMRRTRENLERLTDIREELERQLQHLHRQAQSAEKYKEYKAEERTSRAQLSALRWKRLDEEVGEQELKISELETRYEGFVAEQRRIDAEIEALRETHHDATEAFNEVQARYYQLGNEVARFEQTMQHRQEQSQQLLTDIQDAERQLHEAGQESQADADRVEESQEALQLLEPEQEAAAEKVSRASEELAAIEQRQQEWQSRWDAFNQNAQGPKRQAEVAQSRIQHLERVVEQLHRRQENLYRERDELSSDPEAENLETLLEQTEELEQRAEAFQTQLDDLTERLQQGREDAEQKRTRYDETKQQLQQKQARKATLDALIKAALGDESQGVQDWLASHQLREAVRLAQNVDVEPGWEAAVEAVLGDRLQAVCVESVEGMGDAISRFKDGTLTLVSGPSSAAPSGDSLLSKVRSDRDLSTWLAPVQLADSLDDALARRGSLQSHQSLITRDGIWVGPSWLRVRRGEGAADGLLSQQQERDDLIDAIDELEVVEEDLEVSLNVALMQQKSIEEEREQLQRDNQQLSRQLAEAKSELSGRQVQVEQLRERRERLAVDIQEVESQMAEERETLAMSREELQQSLDAMEEDVDEREALLGEREEFRISVDEKRDEVRALRDAEHQLQLKQQTLQTEVRSLQASLERASQQKTRAQERLSRLKEQLSEREDPSDELKEELEQKLEAQMELEGTLNDKRSVMEAADSKMRELEQARAATEQQAMTVRSEMEQQKMNAQTQITRRATLAEQLAEQQFDLDTVLANLPEDATETAWEEALERLAARIQRLGPINLAAIEEYQTQSERKRYLDEQDDDLQRALETLENAIRKIDRETRTRFKDTFDRVNQGLQDLFPKVFGGGHAYLELTGDDLLDTGVAIMARPPGKRNSTIHLLSGGEKALTAIALVFSIFRLNPSPFCMLDEVDAPLDDANVGRYARLVEAMSEHVQFIYITHNKISMEMAHQLMGVTMNEPGVSRLVSVNVEEAAELAAI
ncbi:chromosome segregation protein SMC [Saccharospirillum sp. MSK14-1]|uniref:chromosome segregation protein SMC n=1 Tax=Saccharospirillum sp. MSK14-1 TaxID=1897632 RepID=UPI000D386D4E|nr:chromosome segregation protein SMC [Saccharospirillum sp. MSK14-1]PTY36419.1 chromosome segregation protein SMC [Saccharospirillum sp. MSK14-1]